MVIQSRKKFLAADDTRCPGANRQNDRVRDQIAREDPGSLTGAGTEIAGNVRKGHVCNRGIENLHEGGQCNRCRNQPRVGLRLPVLATTGLCGHPLLHLWNESGSFSIMAGIRLNLLSVAMSIGGIGVLYKDILYLKAYCM